MEQLIQTAISCDYRNLQTVLRELLKRQNAQDKAIAALTQTVESRDGEIAQLKDALSKSNDQMGELRTEVSEIRGVLRDHTQAIQDLNGKIEILQDATGQTDITALQESVKAMGQRIEAHGDAMGVIRKDVADNEKEISALQTSVGRLTAALSKKADKTALDGKADKRALQDLRDHLHVVNKAIGKLKSAIGNGGGGGGDRDRRSRESIDVKEVVTDGGADGQGQDGNDDGGDGDGNGGGGGGGGVRGGVTREYVDQAVSDLHGKLRKSEQRYAELVDRVRHLHTLVEMIDKRDAEQYQSLYDAIQQLKKQLQDQEDDRADLASKQYANQLYEDLLKKLKGVEKAAGKATRGELKRFERDLMLFLEDREKGLTESAAGRVHFRCLSCDQMTSSQHGPHSRLFMRGVGQQAPLDLTADRTQMAVERGDGVTLYGRDGNIYKGREADTVTIVSGNPYRNARFSVRYSDKSPHNRTVSQGSGTSMGLTGRPQSAPQGPNAPGRPMSAARRKGLGSTVRTGWKSQGGGGELAATVRTNNANPMVSGAREHKTQTIPA